MSPAAVEFQSPMTSSSIQNPTVPPFSFTSDTAGDRVINSNALRRSRPRMAKIRKQVGKARMTAAKESGPEFNPFRSKVEGSSIDCAAEESCRGSDNASVSTDSSFAFTCKGKAIPKNGVLSDLNGECDAEKSETAEEVKSGNFNFPSFGVNQSDFVSRSNLEESECKGGSAVFGTTWQSLNVEDCGSGANNDENVVDCQGKLKVERERVEVTLGSNVSMGSSENHIFAFSAGNEKCSSADNSELDNRACENSTRFRSESEEKCASSSGCSNVDLAFELPDEMEKLNINECGDDIGDVGNVKDSSADVGVTFVFGSSGRSSDTSNVRELKNDSADFADGVHVHSFNAGISSHRETESCGNSNFESFDESSCKLNCEAKTKAAASTTTFDSQPHFSAASTATTFDSQPSFSGASTAGDFEKDENFPSTPIGSGISFTEFISANWDPSSFKANLYSEPNKNMKFTVKSRSRKDKRPKRKTLKVNQFSLPKRIHESKDHSSLENPKSQECYSPMDFSPYMDAPLADNVSREMSATSSDSCHQEKNNVRCVSDFTESNPEVIETNSQNSEEIKRESLPSHSKFPSEGYIFGGETAYTNCKEEVYNVSASTGLTRDEDVNKLNQNYFAFSASTSAEGSNRAYRKTQLSKRIATSSKKRVSKVGSASTAIPNISLSNMAHNQEKDNSLSESMLRKIFEVAEQVEKVPVSSTTEFEETCKKWRSRGNQAYKSGNMSKAEDFYTQGIDSVPSSEAEGCCIKPLVLCYSNRAAARISLGRIREALEDCLTAAKMDPYFLKVYVRAANCHLLLGEIENAIQYYNKLLESGVNLCLDRKITIEAADGLQKAQKVEVCIKRGAELLECQTLEAASEALEIITDALSISSRSEKLLEMKAEALCLLRKYEETIQLCEQTLNVAEKNFSSVDTDGCSINLNSSKNYPLARLWRWYLISKSYFYMGKLEAALELLQKLEKAGPTNSKQGSRIIESSISLAATIQELLRCKNAGNEAFKSGNYTEALEHYTVALSSNVESRPFAAICFCNRAAAHQALGRVADAIADCSLSIALDGSYSKAFSRRAVLHEMIRDYAQAATDLQRLMSILQTRSDEMAKQCGSTGRSTVSKEIKQASGRMSLMEQESKEGVPLDFYLILGVKVSDAASDIKKAYRKAALRHHPDKASQFLAKTESGDEGKLWKEIANEVHKDADRLFKMIGEAYAILSDSAKRSEYDQEEEMRKAMKEIHRSSTYTRRADSYEDRYYTFRKSGSKHSWHDNWKTYGHSHSRW